MAVVSHIHPFRVHARGVVGRRAMLTAAIPLIADTFGGYGTYLVLPGLGAAIGIAVAVSAWAEPAACVNEAAPPQFRSRFEPAMV